MILVEVGASLIAKKAKAGQFIILCVNEFGEGIPLTIADYDREEGTVTVILQKVGKTILLFGQLEEEDRVSDFIGPPGTASHPDGYKKAAVIGGDTGCATAYPQAKALYEMDAHVDMIAGFHSQDIIIPEDEIHAANNNLFLMTGDGPNGNKGLATGALEARIDAGTDYGLVVVIGPLFTMRAVDNLTRPYGIKTITSTSPIMIDDTGMYDDCRVMVDDETRFTCVDGPDLGGHLIDLDEIILRIRTYREDEARATREYNRHLMKGAESG